MMCVDAHLDLQSCEDMQVSTIKTRDGWNLKSREGWGTGRAALVAGMFCFLTYMVVTKGEILQ